MRRRPIGPIALGVASLALAAGWLRPVGAQPKEPVYVGVRVCSECHAGPEAGHQFSIWRRSAHAKAFATLALPESEEIARISGIPEPPHEARVCLGCHATGADVEAWERDETFHVEDGIQCEGCHGPGSEYIDDAVMSDPQVAMERGLRKPEASDCMVCHCSQGLPRGGPRRQTVRGGERAPEHRPRQARRRAPVGKLGRHGASARHERAPLHRGHGLRRVPLGARDGVPVQQVADGPSRPRLRRSGDAGRARRWRAGPGSWAIPRRATRVCAATRPGPALPERSFAAGFDPAGRRAVRELPRRRGGLFAGGRDARPGAAAAAGLQEPSGEVCLSCHQQGHAGAPFDYEAAVARIAHPTQPPAATAASEPRYKTPVNLALTPDGREL